MRWPNALLLRTASGDLSRCPTTSLNGLSSSLMGLLRRPFSRNASSLRTTPRPTQVKWLVRTRAIPERWLREHDVVDDWDLSTLAEFGVSLVRPPPLPMPVCRKKVRPIWTNICARAARLSTSTLRRLNRRHLAVDASSASCSLALINSVHLHWENGEKRLVNFSRLIKPPRGFRERGTLGRSKNSFHPLTRRNSSPQLASVSAILIAVRYGPFKKCGTVFNTLARVLNNTLTFSASRCRNPSRIAAEESRTSGISMSGSLIVSKTPSPLVLTRNPSSSTAVSTFSWDLCTRTNRLGRRGAMPSTTATALGATGVER